MALLPIVGFPSDNYLPGTRLEINFNQGVSSAGIGPRQAVYCMPMLSTGTAQVNQLLQIKNEAEAVTYFGAGSMLHRGLRAHFKANKINKVYALPYAVTSGGSPASADGYITLTGTASGRGSVKLSLAAEEFEVAFSSGDTASAIGDLIESSVLSRNWLPCDATNVAGKVTFQAKTPGKSQGDGTTGIIRYRASVTSGVGLSVSAAGAALGLAGGGTAGVDGSTTEATNLTNALATITNIRKYFIAVSVWDSTSLTALRSHIATKSLASPGLRSVSVSGHTGSLSTAKTLALAMNNERMAIIWQPVSEHDVVELVGSWTALRLKYESTSTKTNFDFYRGSDFLIKPAYLNSDFPDSDDLNDAITDGLTPIASDDSGAYVVTSATTRTKDQTGTVQDRRSSESHRVAIADEVGDTHLSRHVATFVNFALKDDELNSDGTVNTNQKIGPRVITPARYKKFVCGVLDLFGTSGKDLLDKLSDSKDSIATNKDPNNNGRLECAYDIKTVDLLHQTSIRIAEVSQG